VGEVAVNRRQGVMGVDKSVPVAWEVLGRDELAFP